MSNFIAEGWRRLWRGGQHKAQAERERLLIMLDSMVAECEREAQGLNDQALLSGKYYAVARAAREGRYAIQPDRIAEVLLRA
ncbi:MAG: hypothetical protein R3E02_09215 [Blastomonas sp.]